MAKFYSPSGVEGKQVTVTLHDPFKTGDMQVQPKFEVDARIHSRKADFDELLEHGKPVPESAFTKRTRQST